LVEVNIKENSKTLKELNEPIADGRLISYVKPPCTFL